MLLIQLKFILWAVINIINSCIFIDIKALIIEIIIYVFMSIKIYVN